MGTVGKRAVNVKRTERNVLRVAPDGSLTIPASMMILLCNRMNRGNKAGLVEDLRDFGPGRIVVLDHCQSETGTEITIRRDQRTEAK